MLRRAFTFTIKPSPMCTDHDTIMEDKMKKEDIHALEAEVKRLREENAQLKAAQGAGMNPCYRELINHLITGPKTIGNLAELMTRDNRTISQWLHQIKTRHGAEIITLTKGEKQLANPQIFLEVSDTLKD